MKGWQKKALRAIKLAQVGIFYKFFQKSGVLSVAKVDQVGILPRIRYQSGKTLQIYIIK